MAHRHVVSLVEKGWPAARWAAAQLAERGCRVHHIVRGRIPNDLLRELTQPPGTRITSVAARWYRLRVWAELSAGLAHGWSSLVLVDNERAERWARMWFPMLGGRILLVRETDGHPVLVKQGQAVTIDIATQEAGR